MKLFTYNCSLYDPTVDDQMFGLMTVEAEDDTRAVEKLRKLFFLDVLGTRVLTLIRYVED